MTVSAAVLVASAALGPLVGTEFMPPLDEGSIAINVVRLPNALLAGSVKVASYVEKRLREFPEVATVVSKTGRAEISWPSCCWKKGTSFTGSKDVLRHSTPVGSIICMWILTKGRLRSACITET